MFALNLVKIFLELVSVFAISLVLFYYFYYKYCFVYWKKKGVPTLKPKFPFGDLSLSSALGYQSVFIRLQEIYNEFKLNGYKYGGIYFLNGPIYFPVDPEAVKRVLVTDFDYFIDRGMYEDENALPLSSHIFSMKGDKWKRIRLKISPSFTAVKMKNMYAILMENCDNLVRYLTNYHIDSEFNIKDVLLRFSADVIGSTSFGIDADSLNNPTSQFSQMVERISHHSSWKLLKVALIEGLQNPGNIEKIAYDDKIIEQFFTNLVIQTINYRDNNKIQRYDFLNTLMSLRQFGITPKEIVAQAYLFFIAGFKTSAFTICYCIHELAHNQEIQEKLRSELLKITHNYDDIFALQYLDMVLKETMRKYPPLPMLNRICVKEYRVPGNGSVIEPGTPVVISVLGLHRDPEFYPEPERFDPERFNGVNRIVPYTYMPFGDGPRNCVGLRFGMITTKLTVAYLVKNFRILANDKTPKDLVIDPSTTSIVLNVLDGFYVKLSKIL